MTGCVDCGNDHRFVGSTRCRSCYDRRRRRGQPGVCRRCTKARPIHDPAGRCDWCVYACRDRPARVDPACIDCGEFRPIVVHGRCSRCTQRSPETTRTYARGLAERVGDTRPSWFDAFVAHVSERYSPSEARLRLRELARILPGEVEPDRLVALATYADGRLSPLGRALDEFFDAHGLATARGDTDARAARRRRRVIDGVPGALCPTVAAFSAAELANRQRARRAGGRVLTDQTLLIHLQVVADFARALPVGAGWPSVSQSDVEAFLARRTPPASPDLPSLRAFFSWARTQRLILVDPTRRLRMQLRRQFSGPVVDLRTQRQLFRRWTTAADVAPNEALIGLLTLLHAASVDELRHVGVVDIDHVSHTIAFARRSHPVPLDPPTWTALERVLAQRDDVKTKNPHVLVNRRTRVNAQPVSPAYAGDLLQPLGVGPQRLRCTRLAQLVTTTDPILVVELFGICHKGALYYLADIVDEIRLPNP